VLGQGPGQAVLLPVTCWAIGATSADLSLAAAGVNETAQDFGLRGPVAFARQAGRPPAASAPTSGVAGRAQLSAATPRTAQRWSNCAAAAAPRRDRVAQDCPGRLPQAVVRPAFLANGTSGYEPRGRGFESCQPCQNFGSRPTPWRFVLPGRSSFRVPPRVVLAPPEIHTSTHDPLS